MDHILSERSAFFYEEIETKSVWIYGIDGKKHYEGHQNFPGPRLKKEADSSNIISRVFIKVTEHKTIRAAGLDGKGKMPCILAQREPKACSKNQQVEENRDGFEGIYCPGARTVSTKPVVF